MVGTPPLTSLLHLVFNRWHRCHCRRLSETYLTGTTQGVRIQQTRTDRIDLRENAMDFPNQPIITRDNVEIQVHPLLFYKLIDPVRVAYEVRLACVEMPAVWPLFLPSFLPSFLFIWLFRPMICLMLLKNWSKPPFGPSLATWVWTILWRPARRLSALCVSKSKTFATTGAWKLRALSCWKSLQLPLYRYGGKSGTVFVTVPLPNSLIPPSLVCHSKPCMSSLPLSVSAALTL